MIFRILFALGLIAGIIAFFTPVTVMRENGVETPASHFDIVMDDISDRTRRFQAGEPSLEVELTGCLLEAYVSLVAPARGSPGVKDPVGVGRSTNGVVTFESCRPLREQLRLRDDSGRQEVWFLMFCCALTLIGSAMVTPGLNPGLVLWGLFLLSLNVMLGFNADSEFVTEFIRALGGVKLESMGILPRVQAALCCLGLLAGLTLRAPLGLRARAEGSRDPGRWRWETRLSRIGVALGAIPFVLWLALGLFGGALEILTDLQAPDWGLRLTRRLLPFIESFIESFIVMLGLLLLLLLVVHWSEFKARWAARRRKPGAE
jgi:hypothetical protein